MPRAGEAARSELEQKIRDFFEDFFASPTDRRFWWVPIVFFGLGEPVLNRHGKVLSWRIVRKVPKDERGWQAPEAWAPRRHRSAL